MLALILIIAIVVLLFNSFSKFNSVIRDNERIVNEASKDLRIDPDDIEVRYAKAVGLMRLQKYPDAIREFKAVANAPYVSERDAPLVENASKNILFCLKPLPWSGETPEDKTGSYIHSLLIKYFGNSRVILSRK